MKQGQTLNLKWSVGDVDRVVAEARRGRTAAEICRQLKGTRLESTVGEIMGLCLNSGFSVRRGINPRRSRRRA